jgi:hypothetical protein
MKIPSFNPAGVLRPASMDRNRGDAGARAAARQGAARVDPPPFTSMQVKRLVPGRQNKGLVIDMEDVSTAAAPATVSPSDEALIRASKARLASRVQRLRETVSGLRLDIETLRR